MCGRYALVDGKRIFATYALLKHLTEVGKPFDLLPRYNAAPMQQLPVIAMRDDKLVVEPMRWWLTPHWSKDGKVQFSTFNAKAETLEKSKLYFPYFKGSRCLVPVDAFYEWKKIQVETKEKQPMCIRMKDEAPFMLAGLFSVWREPKTEAEHPTFSIITTEPNALMAEIHNRMPVICHEKNFEQWLDRGFHDTAALRKLLVPYPAGKMKAYRVSKVVSNSRNDIPECMKPLKD
jgi:putative SOS response-associated peptidase YedK